MALVSAVPTTFSPSSLPSKRREENWIEMPEDAIRREMIRDKKRIPIECGYRREEKTQIGMLRGRKIRENKTRQRREGMRTRRWLMRNNTGKLS